MIEKRKISILCICLLVLVFGMVGMTGCNQIQKAVEEQMENQLENQKEEEIEEEVEEEEEKKEDKEEKKDNTIIVAGSVDTSSNFSFSVEEALIGFNYNEEPIVVLVGTFTNDSEDTISFSWALDATAVQGGYTLPTAYVSGSGDYNYNEIAPENTIPIILAWKIADGDNDITLTVVDSRHYAKEEIYSQTFTIDELIENTENYHGAEDIIDRSLEVEA